MKLIGFHENVNFGRCGAAGPITLIALGRQLPARAALMASLA